MMKTNELTIEATVENLPQVMAFLEQHLEEADCPLKTQMQITVAAEEIYVNIAHYAYKPVDGTVEITCAVTRQDGQPPRMTLCFKDRGKPFDPLAREDPDITLSAEERGIGGLGIFLTYLQNTYNLFYGLN